jgi:CheY-like chemotaxis protein
MTERDSALEHPREHEPMPWEDAPTPPHGDPLSPGEPADDDVAERTLEPPVPAPQPERPHGDPLRKFALEPEPPEALEADLAALRPDSMAVALADLLVGLLEYRDPFFRGGTSLTRLLTAAIARELGLDEDTANAIALGAVLRDLGQLPLKGLIDRPGSELGADGRRRMERHVDTALELLEGVSLPRVTRETIRHHHERWDGTGYPDGLAGTAIPIGARIVAVADSFAAMIAARPHRLPKRVPAALEDIRAGAGRLYDSIVVDALVRVLSSTSWRGLRFGLRHHVLVVDPDETRAMVIATRLCSHGYLAEAAFNAESARERLERTRIVGLVVSAELPGDEVGGLLRAVRETERLAMVPVLAIEAGAAERIALLEAGADVCLGRHATFEEVKATLEAFLRREGKPVPDGARAEAPWSGLQGDIEDFPLAWLLQVLNYDGRTAAVFLAGADDDGAIYLEAGEPRHAVTRARSGEDALRDMLKWPAGTFSVDPDSQPDERTISLSLMKLLMQQAVDDDHAAFFGAVKV